MSEVPKNSHTPLSVSNSQQHSNDSGQPQQGNGYRLLRSAPETVTSPGREGPLLGGTGPAEGATVGKILSSGSIDGEGAGGSTGELAGGSGSKEETISQYLFTVCDKKGDHM